MGNDHAVHSPGKLHAPSQPTGCPNPKHDGVRNMAAGFLLGHRGRRKKKEETRKILALQKKGTPDAPNNVQLLPCCHYLCSLRFCMCATPTRTEPHRHPCASFLKTCPVPGCQVRTVTRRESDAPMACTSISGCNGPNHCLHCRFGLPKGGQAVVWTGRHTMRIAAVHSPTRTWFRTSSQTQTTIGRRGCLGTTAGGIRTRVLCWVFFPGQCSQPKKKQDPVSCHCVMPLVSLLTTGGHAPTPPSDFVCKRWSFGRR